MARTDLSELKILAVDDNPEGLATLTDILSAQGFRVVQARSGSDAIARAESDKPDLILLDVMMPEPNGYEVTKFLKNHPSLRFIPVILLTGRDELQDIVFGLEQGADDYICKPYNTEELLARLHAVSRVRLLYKELDISHSAQRALQAQLVEHRNFDRLIGKSRAMEELSATLSKVVDSEVPVLITGESGTGKEVVAGVIHCNGPRRDKPFVVQNCAALQDTLLESELFGHVRGSFTGAIKDKAGLFEVADGGTLFLDEVGEMSPALQVKLLRVLQDGSFTPVGGTRPRQGDVRIIAATHRDLEKMTVERTFREDLYYRLNVINVKLPPLRERTGDVPLLVDFILGEYSKKFKRARKNISASALEILERYNWPGNIRQLENEIQRAIVMSGNVDLITDTHLSPNVTGKSAQITPPAGVANLRDALELMEKQIIADALVKTGGNKSEAARQLGISRSNLITKAQTYGLSSPGDE